ncbi:MAG: bifunctional hydroxymethylpyrimidine kinase/phosphomethylpyrimidine kinase [Magnetococcales bacterium]|nr:bifunctional hydroxymethylpyrimidine kinase/phosphomethylpyrimidine kinase [Magnetococcales bacterium]
MCHGQESQAGDLLPETAHNPRSGTDTLPVDCGHPTEDHTHHHRRGKRLLSTSDDNSTTAKILVVAGSDPTCGAGLQADLRTITALGGHPMTAVTAVTVQDTHTVKRVEAVEASLVASQMRVVLEDMGADAIKLGMLANGEIVNAVADVLTDHPDLPVVADPVLAGTRGGLLLNPEGRKAFMDRLLPRVTLLTPNIPESEQLTGVRIRSMSETERVARALARQVGSHGDLESGVLITGGHRRGEMLVDLLVQGDRVATFQDARIRIVNDDGSKPGIHGTGCALASAIATHMAQGLPMKQAVQEGRTFVRTAIRKSTALGHGQRLLRLSPP